MENQQSKSILKLIKISKLFYCRSGMITKINVFKAYSVYV